MPQLHTPKWVEVDCVAASGVMCFSVHGSGHALFYCCEDNQMDINFLKDILFDLINESDALDPYLEDIECDDRINRMTVITKDGTRYTIQVSEN